MVWQHKAFITSIPLALMVATGCGRQFTEASSDTATDTAGETSEDEVGDSGTESTTTNGTETTTTSDDGCPVGTEGCPCTDEGECDPGLICEGGTCSPEASTTDGTTDDGTTDDGTTDDGTTDDTTTEDTTTEDTGSLCDELIAFEVEAEDATDIQGWSETMSMLGEGVVLAYDDDGPDYVSWDLDIPCDDTWHIWVRGINQGQSDSFWVQVDGQPDPAVIFEIACDGGPSEPIYQWRELNWREPNAGPCEYDQDPWTHDWAAGQHNLTLVYRESYALSKIWITNGDQSPP